MSGAYYNEFDKDAAAWLRELIRRDLIAPGDVDERSIEDVRPDDLRGYTQHHFFAGIGGWSYALRLAGWPDDQRVWTGSCPCQPFSQAGQGAGFDDQRHLWPAFFHLIRECRPAIVFGEQVASKAADVWIDLVHADLEGMGYAFGCIPFPSAGIGAPHIRDRNYWLGVGLAHSNNPGLEGWGGVPERAAERAAGSGGMAGRVVNPDSQRLGEARSASAGERPAGGRAAFGVADAYGRELEGRAIVRGDERHGQDGGRSEGGGSLAPRGETGRLAHSGGDRREMAVQHDGGGRAPSGEREANVSGGLVAADGPGPLHGFWRAADWLFCRDGKWRPVEPGSFPLAHGLPARVVRLRGYGNAINPHQAAEFIEAARESLTARLEHAA